MVNKDKYGRRTIGTAFNVTVAGKRQYAVQMRGAPRLENGMVVTAVLRDKDNWQTLVGWLNHPTDEICGVESPGISFWWFVAGVLMSDLLYFKWRVEAHSGGSSTRLVVWIIAVLAINAWSLFSWRRSAKVYRVLNPKCLGDFKITEMTAARIFRRHLPHNAVSDGERERPLIRYSLKPLQPVSGGSRFDPCFHRLAPQYEQRAESKPHAKRNQRDSPQSQCLQIWATKYSPYKCKGADPSKQIVSPSPSLYPIHKREGIRHETCEHGQPSFPRQETRSK